MDKVILWPCVFSNVARVGFNTAAPDFRAAPHLDPSVQGGQYFLDAVQPGKGFHLSYRQGTIALTGARVARW